jgi:hypothetical protein
MEKILQLPEFFATGEATMAVVGHWGRQRWSLEKTAFDRSAASPAYEFLKDVKPQQGHTIVLVNALGAYETYDSNRNGDAWSEHPFKVGVPAKCGHKECQAGAWVSEAETLPKHYKTFEQHGGIYLHHKNTDPSKSLGDVMHAFWNERMHRVELLLKIVNAKNPDLITRIEDGEYPAVSMGCRVPWDVCTICGHHAPTRKQYCEHVKGLGMNKVDPKTGERACVLNPSPKFFDISFVFRPADPTGFMLKKVAQDAIVLSSELGEKFASEAWRKLAVHKVSEIQKRLTGQILATKADDTVIEKYRKAVPKTTAPPALSKEVKAELDISALPVVLATLAANDVTLTCGELTTHLCEKMAGFTPTAAELDKVVALQPLMREVLASYPGVAAEYASLVSLDPRDVSPMLQRRWAGYIEKRAGWSDWASHQVNSRLGSSAAQDTAAPKTDMLSVTDPNSGQVWKTQRGAAQDADHTNRKSTLGAAALLSTLYGVALGRDLPLVGAPLKNSPWRWPVAITAGALTAGPATDLVKQRRPGQYLTDQGVPVPQGTEFAKSSGLKQTTVLDKLAADYQERAPGPCPAEDLAARLASTPWLASAARGEDLAAKVAALFADAIVFDADGLGADLDPMVAALRLGRLLTT